ncbi:RecF/RecN/SMC protein [Sistotremastrum suecicum HHB10207 ss-3]|uniref:Structural maintenance of chromosomes protein n=1 Tax=Sistotremastrum suecicum HHB10207 ss-3 TaxID=1314776 RepID=A0A165Z2R3_9AGAM|nr:RecF/RecN/SMC protein [Sistotremastrum suecicum HHB10207 ss-3]
MVFIKTITIQGFKSYRDQTQVEPFSPGHNVVVGRNGSGKSNFFAAIRFVLSDAYTSMSREERQSLLHEGVTRTTTLSAYVEIVFDNTDNRFPTGHPEVILRRTIGVKKDEYSLDKKSSSKADVMNLLESAGFSKSNPYYIVPQGRITSLTNAKESERLALLKEVAGTKVYETRRAESLKIMEETDAKRKKINELLTYIEERLAELEEEKEELKEFQAKDKERRCLEYAMHSRELEEVGNALDELEEERKQDLHTSNLRRDEYNHRASDASRLEGLLSSKKQAVSLLTIQKRGSIAELNDLVKKRTELQCIVEDLVAASEQGAEKRAGAEKELREVEKKIAKVEKDLERVLPQWREAKEKEAREKRKLDEANAKLTTLYTKQGRLTRFRTKRDRDEFLQSEIRTLESHQATQNQLLEDANEQLAHARNRLVDVENRAESIISGMEDRQNKMKELTVDIGKLQDQKAALMEEQKELWREDAKLEATVSHAKEQLRDAERLLSSMMDKDTGTGLRAVDKIAERHGITGVYGPLYKLLEVPDKSFSIAIEQTAGNSLFHVVVDTDETAQQVLSIMLKEKSGRVTFMPLNRLHPKPQNFPNAQDAVPLIDKLDFDAIHTKAFQQVFGKTCVCKDLTVAAAYVRSHGINAITLDGDKVEKKGAMTGGWHDVRRSRLEAGNAVRKWSAIFNKDNAKLLEVKQQVHRKEQEITKLAGQIQVLSAQKAQAQAAREPMAGEAMQIEREKESLQERIEKLEQEVVEVETDLVSLKARLEANETELSTPMESSLSAEEERLLDSLGKEIDRRNSALAELGKKKSDLGGKKNMLEIDLNENLKRRREELKHKLSSISDAVGEESSDEDLAARQKELETLNTSITELQGSDQQMEKDIEKLNTEIQKLRAELEELQTLQAEDSRRISRQQKNTERYLAKRTMLSNRKDECNRNIRDLGVLPEEAFEKYTNEKLDKLVKKLHTVNEGLKKFAHVNKKAFEQYNNFTKQRDQLIQRREDLDSSAKSIEELVEVLDQRKDEAIERTFKQVALNFEEVFEKLVPAGKGRLIIQRRIDQDEDEEDEDTQRTSIDNYTGVSIKVSFNSKVDEGLRIQQLSGGQKSLVALATVFAIQKCDPAPFYLFDEIDANLDAQYRTAVARMIHELSSTAQFITTTFRPEMLVTADKFYGVLFNAQKVSSIRVISKDDAQEFVDTEMQVQ